MWVGDRGRPKRTAAGGLVYHVPNRAHAGMTIFEDDLHGELVKEFVRRPFQAVAAALRRPGKAVVLSLGRGAANSLASSVCWCVERRALLANLASRAEGLAWGLPSSLEIRCGEGEVGVGGLAVAPFGGLGRSRNEVQTEPELAALRGSVRRGSPFGDASWSDAMVCRPGQESTLGLPAARKTQQRFLTPFPARPTVPGQGASQTTVLTQGACPPLGGRG